MAEAAARQGQGAAAEDGRCPFDSLHSVVCMCTIGPLCVSSLQSSTLQAAQMFVCALASPTWSFACCVWPSHQKSLAKGWTRRGRCAKGYIYSGQCEQTVGTSTVPIDAISSHHRRPSRRTDPPSPKKSAARTRPPLHLGRHHHRHLRNREHRQEPEHHSCHP